MAVSKTRNDSALAPSAKKTRSGSETRKRGPKINFRVSESELAQIQVAAERAGLTVGSYVRSRSLKEPTTRAVRRPPVATAQLAQLLGLLSAAGSDLQRLAPLTVAGAADQDRDIHAVLSLLREAATAILQALGEAAMIINGGSRSNAAFFAKHLTNGEHNESVTLCEMRKLAADNVPDAFRVMAAIAMGTLCENFFYHANINPRENEELTAGQWQIAVDTLEKHLCLTGHPRFVVEHRKAGRTHRHVIWLRIDIQSMTAVVMANDYEKHQAAARELEDLFKLDKVQSVSGRTQASGPRPSRRPKTWESFRGQQSGIDPWKMKQEITQLYLPSKNGAAFVSALEARGYKLVRGNKAAFCILDTAGHLHSLARRIEGVTAAELTAFMQEIDPATLSYPPSLRPSAS